MKMKSCRDVAFSLLVLAFGVSADASNLGFLNDSPSARFSEADFRLLEAAALELLKDGVKGNVKQWSNPEATAAGKLTVIDVFKSSEGFSCKTILFENRAGQRQGRATYPICETRPGDWQIHAAAVPSPAAEPVLEGAVWRAVTIGRNPVVLEKGQPEPFVSFAAAGHRVTGMAGCNRLSADYEVTGRQLSISRATLTRMACVRGMDIERQLTKALEATASWRIEKAQLELLDRAGVVLARFSRAP